MTAASKTVPLPVKSHFLDSGAFSLRRHAKGKVNYREYMDRYAAFIKANKAAIDLYANVDVIPDAEATWKNQKYLEEEHGLRPVPVVHLKTDHRWLKRYLDEGYKIIGLGGLVGKTRIAEHWLDTAFDIVHSTPDRKPCAKLHGFGIVNHRLLVRYPWWSVDSSAWIKEAGKWGAVFVPHRRRGEFVFGKTPYKIIFAHTAVSCGSIGDDSVFNSHPHYLQLKPAEREVVCDWLNRIGVELGYRHGKKVKRGVTNHDSARRVANILFFEALRRTLPRWPWPFLPRRGQGRPEGLEDEEVKWRTALPDGPSPLRIYYSGTGTGGDSEHCPEGVLGRKAMVMLTFYDMPNKRFDRILAGRTTP